MAAKPPSKPGVTVIGPETIIVQRYRRARSEYDAAQQACEEFFLSLAQKHLADGNVAGARALCNRCPDHLTQAFILDAIRRHGKGS